MGLPAVFPKRVTQVWVRLLDLDTAHNRVPIPRYCGYKWVFQPTIFSQQNKIYLYYYSEKCSPNCRVVIYCNPLPLCCTCHVVTQQTSTAALSLSHSHPHPTR